MATISRFEELEIWQLSFKMDKAIFVITRKEPFVLDKTLKSQILRSSGSVMDNIAEGFGRGGKKEFLKFLGISNGLNSEVRSQLHRAQSREYITPEEFDTLYNLSVEIGVKTNKFMRYLQNTIFKGTKTRFGEHSASPSDQQSNTPTSQQSNS